MLHGEKKKLRLAALLFFSTRGQRSGEQAAGDFGCSTRFQPLRVSVLLIKTKAKQPEVNSYLNSRVHSHQNVE